MKSALLALTTCLLSQLNPAFAQPSSCDSDGQQPKAALLERFINADCASCWADATTPQPKANEIALDWITPTAKGDDAALSAAASTDSLARLSNLKRKVPTGLSSITTRAHNNAMTLRVANGQVYNDYIGVSIELEGARSGPLTAWLVLVETLPAGAEGSPVERNLVRNALKVEWPASGKQTASRSETRSMSVPASAHADRLRVVGWVQDRAGRTGPVAASVCEPQKP